MARYASAFAYASIEITALTFLSHMVAPFASAWHTDPNSNFSKVSGRSFRVPRWCWHWDKHFLYLTFKMTSNSFWHTNMHFMRKMKKKVHKLPQRPHTDAKGGWSFSNINKRICRGMRTRRERPYIWVFTDSHLPWHADAKGATMLHVCIDTDLP